MATWLHMKTIGICYHANLLKKEKKKKQIMTNHKNFIKTHIVQQTKRQLHNFKKHVELKGSGWHLSMMGIRYKLTKRTKKEKFVKKIENNYQKL